MLDIADSEGSETEVFVFTILRETKIQQCDEVPSLIVFESCDSCFMKQVAALRIRVLSDNLHKFRSTAWHLSELEHLLDNLNGFSKGVKTAILDVLPHFNVKSRGNATDLTEACRRLRGQELVATRNIWIDNAKSFTHRRANICQLGIDIVRIGPRAQRLWLVLSSLAAMVRPTALILLFLGTLTVAER